MPDSGPVRRVAGRGRPDEVEPPEETERGLGFVPRPPPSFVGRRRQVRAIERALDAVPVALLYGMPGAGKSALAYALARCWAGPVCYAQVFADQTPASLLDDLRRTLEGGSFRELDGLQARLTALTATLEARGALLVLDDLHLWPVPERALFVRALGERLGRARLVITSRERLPSAGHYDRYEAVVDSLSKGAARRLWRALDALRGDRPGFDEAWRRGGGNPFALRRAHAGFVLDDDPLASWLDRLDDDARLALNALSIARVPLDAKALGRLVPGGRGERALGVLARLLLVDVDGAGACSVHALVREAVVGTGGEALRQAHLGLAGLLADAGLDPVVGAREVGHHLLEAGEYASARDHLLGAARGFIARGASGELLFELERLPRVWRSDAVDAWRARALVRLLRLGDAAEVLADRLPRAHEGRGALWLQAARVALMRCRLDEADAALGEAEAEAEASADERPVHPLLLRALLEAMRGDVAGAVGRLLEGSAGLPPEMQALLRGAAPFLALLDRYVEARGRPEGVEGYRAAALLPLLVDDLNAEGRAPRDAAALFSFAGAALAAHDDLASRLHLEWMGALPLWEQGQRLDALATLRATSETAERAQYLSAALWLDVWAARALFVLGRCREANELASAAGRRAERLGAGWLARAAEHACREEPARKLTHMLAAGSPLPGASASVRTRCFAALCASVRGDADAATEALAGADAVIARPDYSVERALVRLGEGLRACERGEVGAFDVACAEAKARLREGGADDDLLARLLMSLAEASVKLKKPIAAPKPDATVLDGRRHELRLPGRTLSLRNKPALRALLYTLAAAPNRTASKETLAGALWPAGYDPRRHDNPLFVNVRRLRELLEGTPLAVANLGPDGYVLETPPSFGFLAPLGEGSEDPSPNAAR